MINLETDFKLNQNEILRKQTESYKLFKVLYCLCTQTSEPAQTFKTW